ncbi:MULTISPECIES: hypothetical protein [unclassified Streptomyces]
MSAALRPRAPAAVLVRERALGLDAPEDDEDLRDVIEADAEQVFTDRRPR